MTVIEFLDKFGAEYTVEEDREAVCVREIAARKHSLGTEVAKPVVILADGRYYMCVLPAYCAVNVGAVKERLGVDSVDVLDADEVIRLFPAAGQWPFGVLCGLPTLMDESLNRDEYIGFRGDERCRAIFMPVTEYRRLASPRIFAFGHPGN